MPRLVLVILCVLAGASMMARADSPAVPSAADLEFFEKRIRPLLIESCHQCHSAGQKVRGKLRLDSRAAMIGGGESGPALTPGDPAQSRLITAVLYKDTTLQMPPRKKLSDAAIADLTHWVKIGAPWPTENVTPVTATPTVDMAARAREHWAWQPVKAHKPPTVKNESWVRTDIDRFILAQLEAKKISPSPQADPRTLIRRVTFDLTGLPPTAEEVEAFVKEWEKEEAEKRKSEKAKKREIGEAAPATIPTPETRNPKPDAYSRLVDRLLASPQYGERWARHWLDVVRYADSKDARGMGGEADIPFAYRYRDWVVSAFNHDLPYDQFIMQQIAGDLMVTDPARHEGTQARRHEEQSDKPQTISRHPTPDTRHPDRFDPLIATTMLAIGNWDTGDSDKRKMMSDIVDDQIDVISRGFLGMTVSCARCHDHKFDPISTRDYYALAGFFFSSHIIPAPGDPTAGSPMLRLPLMSEEKLASIREANSKAEALRKQINEQVDVHRKDVITRELGRIKAYLAATEQLYRSDNRDDPRTLTALAARHGIHAAILKRFVRYIGLAGAGGTVPGMFTTKLSEVGKSPLVMGWGEPATPSVLAHLGSAPLKLLTFTLPPRSIAMHPSPTKQVAIGWRSKFTGIVSITGSAADADSVCGNGFAWSIIHQRGSVITRLAWGTADNGGSQTFTDGDNAKRLTSVQVEAGDLISLVIDARDKNHVCDNTTIEFILREAGGAKREWDVSKDIVDSILASNPHADSHGQRDIWHFFAISEDGSEGDAKVPPDSALAHWLASITDAKQASDAQALRKREELTQLIHQFATSGEKPPANQSPANIALHKDLITASSPLWSTIDLSAYSEIDRAPLELMRGELTAQVKLASTKIEFTQGIREGGVPGSEHEGFRDAKVHVRGRYDRLGDVVSRGYPGLLSSETTAKIEKGSGRLELAKWVASADNRMTARVMVNRIWQHHFGKGIVATPDNFGHLGAAPTHPELLDHLATKFIEQGWSIKAMHRMIVMSAAYRQESRVRSPESGVAGPTPDTRHPTPEQLDPDNALLWRQNRRRLDAEQLRDAMLAVAGQLDRSPQLTSGPATGDLNSPRRSIYLLTVRSDRSTFRTLFDAADPTASIHARNESTIAPQALFLLNHPFTLTMAKTLAGRVQREVAAGDEKRIAWLYERLFARPATQREIEIGLSIVREATSGEISAAWQQYCQVLLCANEFVYVD